MLVNNDGVHGMKLHLGCGSITPDSWTNVDYSAGARVAKIPGWRIANKRLRFFSTDWDEHVIVHDLRKALPWKDASVSCIYSSHTLEHLTKAEGRHLLRECFRVLAQGGRIRIVVPDLSAIIARYAKGSLDADDFVDELGVRFERSGAFFGDLLRFSISFPHQCMYDEKTLLRALTEAGFAAEGREAYDSDIPGVADVEIRERVIDSVIAEGVKV